MVSHIYIRRGIGLGLCLTLLAFAGCWHKESSEATRLTTTSVQMEASQEETVAPVLPEEDPSDVMAISEQDGQYFLTGTYSNITADACVYSTRDIYSPGTADIIRAQIRSFDDTDIAKIVEPTWTEVSLMAEEAPEYEVPGMYYQYTYSDPVMGDILIDAYCSGAFCYEADMELVVATYDKICTQIGLSEVAPDYLDTIDDMQTSIREYYSKVDLTFVDSYLAYSATLNGSDFQTYYYFQQLDDLEIYNSSENLYMTINGEMCMGQVVETRVIVSGGTIYNASTHGYMDQTSVVSEDQELCSLDIATDAAVSGISQLSTNQIEITMVKLGYIPVDDESESGDLYLLPCWIFTYAENIIGYTDVKEALVDATTGQWIETTNEVYNEEGA